MDKGTSYYIEKVIKQYKKLNTYDVIYEYAICASCCNKLASQYSQTSLENIQNYFLNHTDFLVRRHELLAYENIDINQWIDNCVIRGTSIHDLEEYQMACHCFGDKMVLDIFPFIIGGEALEEIVKLLSNQTLDIISDFKRNKLLSPTEPYPVNTDYPLLFV
ncbi:hypothetical protein JW960_07465 [candidate division KSB1 bacterium]|nr:hypothetical protein [candidate division KSB1 bacterium]